MSNPKKKAKVHGPGRSMALEKVIFILVAAVILVGVTTYYLASRKGTPGAGIPPEGHGTDDPEIAALIQRFQKDPNDTLAMKLLGNRYYDLQNFSMAEMFYRRYLEINPRNADAVVDLGTVLYYTNRGEEAMQCYQEALRIDPNHKNALFNMGIVRDAMGDRDGAILWWRRFIEVAGDDPHVEPFKEMIAEYESGDREGGKTQ